MHCSIGVLASFYKHICEINNGALNYYALWKVSRDKSFKSFVDFDLHCQFITIHCFCGSFVEFLNMITIGLKIV